MMKKMQESEPLTEIVDVIKCKNPRCITSVEQELKNVFVLTDRENNVYRCKYCETANE